MDNKSAQLKSENSEYLKAQIDPKKMPRHIAIIMDGNGRWARKKRLTRAQGHKAGIVSVKTIVEASVDIGLEILTLYAFSVQNWKRPKIEVNTLMKLLLQYLEKELSEMMENDIRFYAIGDLDRLPKLVQEALRFTIKETQKNKGLLLNLALNYGGQSEICHAVKEVTKKVLQGDIKIEQIDERLFSRYLYTSGMPDPDLLIRTSGEMRISNFLLWQSAYSEFWITKTLWPDFKKAEFFQAIIDFQRRERRFGRASGYIGRKR